MKIIQLKDYNEVNKYEENLNKDNDFKDNNNCINKLYKHKKFIIQVKGALIIIIVLI